jgi:hypothetical protein
MKLRRHNRRLQLELHDSSTNDYAGGTDCTPGEKVNLRDIVYDRRRIRL